MKSIGKEIGTNDDSLKAIAADEPKYAEKSGALNDTRCSIQCGSELIEHSLYPLIQEADQIIRARFPYGAFNRVDVIESQQLSYSELNKCFMTCEAYNQETTDENRRNIATIADITQTLVFYNCGMSVNYVTGYLKNKYPGIAFQSIYLRRHQMLLIGNNVSSSINIPVDKLKPIQIRREIDKWGPNAIICDIWAGKSYFAREFIEEKQNSTILFNNAVLEHDHLKELIPVDGHYLDGDIDIYAGEHSQRYDRMLIEWVKEDQRRFNLPNCKAPKSPLFMTAGVNARQLIPILSQLSQCSGWKYNTKQNIAWVECETPKQAERAALSLRLTKAAIVRVGQNPVNKKPLVRCEYFDFNQLKRLGDSLAYQQQLDVTNVLSLLASMGR